MTTILSDRGDERKIIEEEKTEWVKRVLVALGVNQSIIDDNEADHRLALSNINLEVWSKSDGTVEILRNGKLIAQWNQPKLVLVKEKPGKYYYEIRLSEWALPFQKRRGK